VSLAPRTIGLHSVRAKLMFWNVGVVALVLVAMGGLISYTVRAKLMASVERDLRDHAARVQPPPPEGPMPGPDDDPGRPEFDPRPLRQPMLMREPDGTISNRVPRVFNLDATGRPPFQDKKPWDDEAFQHSLNGEEIVKTILVDGEQMRLLSRPQWPRHGPPPNRGQGQPADADLHLPGDRPVGVVQAIYPLSEINLSMGEMNTTLLTLIPVALILAGIGGAWLTDRALRPVRNITQTAARIGAADLRERLPLSGGDEFAELSGTINGMLERLQLSFGRMEEVVEQQRRFTADASHELKTPLTIIKANSSLTLATQPDREGYHEAMGEIDRAANSMNRLVQDLLLLARSDESQTGAERSLFNAEELLREIARQFSRPGCASIQTAPVTSSLTVCANREEITRVLSNLIENALRYTPADGTITLSAEPVAGAVGLMVTDTGCGISAEHLPHLCERFYRADASRARVEGGSGLGLAICKSLVEANGGRMQITSEVGKGTTVRVILPGS